MARDDTDTKESLRAQGTKHRVEGAVDEMKGHARNAVGALSGNTTEQLKGQAQIIKGNAKQVLGKTEQAIGKR